MTVVTFRGSRAKLARASRHVQELDAWQNEYFSNLKMELFKEHRADPKYAFPIVVCKARLVGPPLPDEASSIAADIIGNLRSVLDLAVCDAARQLGTNDLRNTYFSFADTEEEWERSVRSRMKAASDEIRTFVRGLRPWKSGHRLLYALSKLAAKDKHQLLTPVAAHSSGNLFESIQIVRAEHFIVPGANWDPVRNETILFEYAEGDEIIVGNIRFRVFLAFGPVDLISGQPVVPILDELGHEVQRIVLALEAETARVLDTRVA